MFRKLWKRVCLCSIMGITGCGAYTGVPAKASYRLHPAVKDPTPALRQASAIGVRTYENPELAHRENVDALLIVSFGTTYAESRRLNIDATVAAIQAAHRDTRVALAFTSHIIIDRIRAKEGRVIPTPEQALEELLTAGCTRVALASLDIIPGMEYSYMTAIFDLYKANFKKMTLGTPLLYWMGQEEQRDDVAEFARAFATQFPPAALGENKAILVMAHGTPHPANAYYAVVQHRLNQAGLDRVYVYSVEGWPALGEIIPQLKARGIREVLLMPMMLVAGDHANNDMASTADDSHKTLLEKAGFSVSVYIHGLGENAAVRKMFVDRANEAWAALTGETV